MRSNAERMKRPHVVSRIAEIKETKNDLHPCPPFHNTAAERVAMFEDYVKEVEKYKEPETLSNNDLIELYYGLTCDIIRYTSYGSEHNFAIRALAAEWLSDIKDEMLRRMKRK